MMPCSGALGRVLLQTAGLRKPVDGALQCPAQEISNVSYSASSGSNGSIEALRRARLLVVGVKVRGETLGRLHVDVGPGSGAGIEMFWRSMLETGTSSGWRALKRQHGLQCTDLRLPSIFPSETHTNTKIKRTAT